MFLTNFVVLSALIVSGNAQDVRVKRNDRPRLYSRNGYLFIESAYDRNITINTKGFRVNDIDLLTTLQKAHNALKTEESFQRSADIYQEKLNTIEQKLLLMETDTRDYSNQTVISSVSNTNYLILSRRIDALRRKVNAMRNTLLRNECNSNPCRNGGTCLDLYGTFLCQCPPQWEGITCELDINECSRFAGTDLGCQNGASCINKPGTYECTCLPGWYGIHCTRRSASCSSGSAELCGHGTCVTQNNEKGYKCICDQGWTTDGTNLACTVDVDECKLNHPSCSVNPLVPCINTQGSFACGSCPPGFTGNGYYCSDINECEIFNGGCSINPMVQCINTLGSSNCGLCPPGYFGDGKQCSFRGVCNVDNGGCHYLAQCRDNPRISSTYVECICPARYIGNGIGSNGCTQSDRGPFDPCTSNPCKNGICLTSNKTNDYICKCRRRYTGRNCDILKDPCAPNPCQNGGTCQKIVVYFKCVCPQGFSGTRCQLEKQACGGPLTTEQGVLKYPPSDFRNYDHGVSCAWTIETNSSKVLNLTFTKFNIEKSKGCIYDWLQIHDGRNSAAHNIGRFCGTDLPNNGTIISTHNVIYIWFRSDHTITRDGFELNWTSTEPECGGEILHVGPYGSIQSPGSPGNYPLNRDCSWILAAPLKKRFLFHFFSLIIGDNPDCNHDYLEFSTGDNSVFAKFCNTSHPSPLYSPGHMVVIRFHSDDVDSYPGFQLTYSVVEGMPGCGGVYTTNVGEIHSPTIDGEYPPDMYCEYKIHHNLKSRIKISFVSFNIEDSVGCKFDYVSVHEGSDANAPLVGRYCGTALPAPYISHGNEITILFKTDWATSSAGFRLKFETVCGGKFSQPSGVLESPNYPSKYDDGTTCVYEILQPPGTIIELEFSELNLETNSHPDCLYDYLEIRDGDNANSSLIGRYCKGPIPNIISTHNYLWLSFKSDFSVDGKGFRANYSTISIGCGGILKEKVGTIVSPSHPSGYPSEKKCIWVISAPKDNVIQLTWMTFHVEYSFQCAYDSITIFDNNTGPGLGGLMGKFCGNTPPPTMLSSSNLVTIVFQTDTSINLDGFLGAYSFIHEAQVCGGNYFTAAGVIKSPQYPDNYPTDKRCIWKITVSSGNQILLNITDFNIESYLNCRYDWLEIRNGGSPASPLIGRYCGSKIPKTIPSHSNQLLLEFNSDMTKTGHGFKIQWMSTATGCGGTLSSPEGSIISPHYPEPYDRNTECYWKITISAGSFIRVIFADIELEKHSKCILDYVELFDGMKLNSKSLGKFCRPMGAPFIDSTKNQMLVKFRSDVNFQGRGFQLQYSTVCINTLKGFSGVIESPNFPNNYQGNQNCLWTIEVSQQNRINITFSHFNLESVIGQTKSNSCQYDYIEILYKDFSDISTIEDDVSFTSLGKYCGQTNPGLINIRSHVAQIKFVTDNVMAASGFRLEWKMDGCGGVLSSKEGIIQSPNYPKGYPKSVQCNWIIDVDYGKSIEFTFINVDIEKEESCIYDYIKVYNGRDEKGTLLTTVCHQNKPTVVTSTGNSLYVVFVSDATYQGTGFIANYTTIDTKCGGKMVSATGTISSPNYPNNFDKNETCGWLIEVDEAHTIELEFEDLDLFNFCKNNYVKVFDGPYSSYPLLITACGTTKPNRTIVSSYNQMYIEFAGHALYTTKGFLLNYYKACGARIVTQSSGNIHLSGNEISDRVFNNCSWTITSSSASSQVSLTITFTNLKDSSCEWEDEYKIRVYNGESDDSPMIAKYCGDKLPPTIYSDGPTLHIVLSQKFEFFATYTVIDSQCGGTLTAFSGYISSPGYPKVYAKNTQCEWTIDAAPGNFLTLSFVNFELLDSEKCNTDYLEIRKNNASGTLLGVYCGKRTPVELTHEGSLWLLYKGSNFTSIDVTAKGFLAEYSLSSSNVLIGKSGQIANPLYPRELDAYGVFTYKIVVSSGKRILLTFKEFHFEYYVDESCYFQSLELYDGPNSEDSPLLGSFCGLTSPSSIRSTSNNLFISVSSSSAQVKPKFLLEWLEIDDVFKPNKGNISKISGCGSNETINVNGLQNFTLTSPGYPDGYANNLNCEWIFSTIPTNHLKIYFEDISFTERNVLHNPYCTDKVKVYEMSNNDNEWKHIQDFCYIKQSSNQPIHSTNLMKVVFTTNQFHNGSGFKADIRDECGGSINGPSGYIIYDNTTIRQEECRWNITVKSGRTIRITFLKFNLGRNVQCYNYIMLRNGIYKDSPILGNGKYCGDSNPTVLNTTSNSFSMYYSGHTRTIFKIKYEQISVECGGEILLREFDDTAEITSPNYPNIPPPYTECNWLFVAPPGESLRIDFEERFDLYSYGNCSKEYVQLNNGGTELSPLIGKFCGTNAPNSQITKDNMLYIKFYTDSDTPKNGFKAKVSIDECGGTIRGRQGYLVYNGETSSGRPRNCTWYFVGLKDHYLTISFDLMDISAQNCTNNNKIIISEQNEVTEEVITLGTYCGRFTPLPVNSTMNKVKVEFIFLNTKTIKKGFKMKFVSNVEVCGGTIDADSGFIQSPGYPLTNHYNKNCHWILKAPKGRRITLNLLDFDLDDNALFHEQGLAIFNGLNFRNRVKLFKPGDATDTVESSDNIMSVFFWSSTTSVHRGFKAQFKSDKPTLCVGDFSKDSGIIVSPNNNIYACTWEHRSEINKTLAMTVDITSNTTMGMCYAAFSHLSVYLGNSVIRMCKSTAKRIIRSPYLTNKIEGLSSLKFFLNFTLTYDTHDCGGLLMGEGGFLTSPRFPYISGKTYECAWLIKVPSEQTIKLAINNLNLDSNCDNHFLSVYNGESSTHPRIGKFCQNNKPDVIKSSSNKLWVEYRCLSQSAGIGFSLTYEPIINGCGGIFHDNTRIIQTPGYDDHQNYLDNSECIWEVRSRPGYFVRVKFLDRFFIEDSPECADDYVEVLDYKNDQWISLMKKCGRETPKDVHSTGDKIRIIFRSGNNKITATGFKAKWDLHCGGTFVATDMPQYIRSPGYPDLYATSLYCQYNITNPAKVINLSFEDFELEGGTPGCKYDNVTIAGHYSPIPVTYCGNDKPGDLRIKDLIVITFKTDRWLNKRGFKFMYKNEVCGEKISTGKTIMSPNLYVSNTQKKLQFSSEYVTCKWEIEAPKGRVVVLRFQQLNLPLRRNCYSQNLEIYKTFSANLTDRLAILCGKLDSNPPVIQSPTNNMLVVLRYNTASAGFKADVYFTFGPESGCGGDIQLSGSESKLIEAPNLEGVDCHWAIQAPPSNAIKIQFNQINLATCGDSKSQQGNCSCSYIEVRDGAGTLSNLIEKICSEWNTQSDNRIVITDGRFAHLRYYAVGKSDNGFKVTVKSTLTICGEAILNVTNHVQTLSSPSYPNNYPSDTKCIWLLKAPTPRDRIFLHFNDFDLVEENNNQFTYNLCAQDKLVITDDINTNLITEGLGPRMTYNGKKSFLRFNALDGKHEFCGKNEKMFDFYSPGNSLTIIFSSGNSPNHGKGFMLEYLIAGCNRNFTSEQGRLVEQYGKSEKCIITLTSPDNTTISLYFKLFIISMSTKCETSGMEIRDGDSSSSPVLLSTCGYRVPNPAFSTGNKLWIKTWNTASGFRTLMYDLTYTSTDKGRGCGGDLYNYKGVFTSPMYPDEYRNNTLCTWNVRVPVTLLLAIKFTVFDFVGQCNVNYVNVVTYSKGIPSEHKYCSGDVPTTLYSDNHVTVIYQASTTNGGRGWQAIFQGVTDDTKVIF